MKVTNGKALILFAALGSACGSGEAAGSEELTAMELVRTSRENPQQAAKTVMAAAREVVELPSHRRLKAFLPTSLPGLEQAALESEHGAGEGRAVARGRYQPADFDYEETIEVEISYFGKPVFNVAEQLFASGLGKRGKVAGFEAMIDEDEALGSTRFEIYVRLAPELWVKASGRGPYERVQAGAAAVDLAALAAALGDGQLFEELEADRLERLILSPDALEALLPARLGALEQGHANGHALLDEAPLHSRATGRYGSGALTVFDYGDEEIAQAVELGASGLPGFAVHATGKDSVEQGALEVAGGRGSWAALRFDPPRASVLALHLARGRIVAEYTGTFMAEMAIDDSLPAEVRMEIERAQKEMGAGAFESIEAQRDAIVAAFEALDLEALQD